MYALYEHWCQLALLTLAYLAYDVAEMVMQAREAFAFGNQLGSQHPRRRTSSSPTALAFCEH